MRRAALLCLIVALSACSSTRTTDLNAAVAPKPPNPCENAEYIQIRAKPLAKMSEREFQYFMATVEKLPPDRHERFLALDLECAQHEREEAERTKQPPPPPPTPARSLMITVPVLIILLMVAGASV